MNWSILISFASLLLAVVIFYKVRKIHLLEFRIVETLAGIQNQVTGLSNLYNQLQTYQDLVSLIKPAKPLPLLRGWAASPDFCAPTATV